MGKASRRKSASRARELFAVTESRLKEAGLDLPLRVRTDLPQEEKISHAIGKILHDEVEEGSSLDEYRHHANAIVMAWNVSLMSEEGQKEVMKGLADFVEKSDPSGAHAAQAMGLRLVEKKRAMFPDDKRYIVAHEVRFVGSQVHVTAAAVSPPPAADTAT